MPFNIGPGELIIVLIIALIVVGPGKLPDVGSALGKSIREFRKAATDVKESTSLEPVASAPSGTAPSGTAPSGTAPEAGPQAITPPAPVAAAPVATAPVAAAMTAVATPDAGAEPAAVPWPVSDPEEAEGEAVEPPAEATPVDEPPTPSA